MITIKILGPGCPNCDRVEEYAAQAVEQWHSDHPQVEVTIEKVTDTDQFMNYGLLATPGLVVDEKLVSSGKIPRPSRIIEWLEQAAAG